MPKSDAINGQDTRSERTKLQLIEAAIEVFGRIGFEAASTRELCQVAKVNQAAIPYHFGGKRELYLAAAEHIAGYASHILVSVTSPQERFSDGVARLNNELCEIARIILSENDPSGWTAFVARCAYEDGDAYTIIHDRAVAPAIDRMTAYLVSVDDGPDVVGAARTRITALFTAMISFRLLKGIMLRGSPSSELGPQYMGQITGLIDDLCRSDFLRRAPGV
jgi:AcrR family transcriptional regulator